LAAASRGQKGIVGGVSLAGLEVLKDLLGFEVFCVVKHGGLRERGSAGLEPAEQGDQLGRETRWGTWRMWRTRSAALLAPERSGGAKQLTRLSFDGGSTL
jgi:hypothetical protein